MCKTGRRLPFLVEALGKKWLPYLFLFVQAAHRPWLLSPRLLTSSNPLTLILSLPYKDPQDFTGPTQIVQNKLLDSKSLTYSHL